MGLPLTFTRRARAYLRERAWTEASTADHVRAVLLRQWTDANDHLGEEADPAHFDPSEVIMSSVPLEPGLSLLDEDGQPERLFWAVRGHKSGLEVDLGRWVKVPVSEIREQFPLTDEDGDDNFAPGGRFYGIRAVILPRAFEEEGTLH